MLRSNRKAWIITILLLVAVYELTHLVSGRTWHGYLPSANWVAVVLLPLWGSAVFGLLTNRPWQWMSALVALIGAVIHGAVLRLGLADGGYFFFALGLAGLLLAVPDVLADFHAHREVSDLVEGEEEPRIRRVA